MTDQVISVSWPPISLSPDGWRRRLEDLAVEAEALVGRCCNLQQSAELALQWVGLCWAGMSPETIAASCRASLLLERSVVMSAAPADQVQEIAERLDRIWQEAQADPSGAVVTLPGPPILQHLTTEKQSAQLGRQKKKKVLEPEEVVALEPGLPEVITTTEPDPDELPAEVLPQTQTTELAPTSAAPPPASWLHGGEVAELLGVSRTSVAQWRKAGRMGAEGIGWVRSGRLTWFDSAVIEQLEEQRITASLDELLAKVQGQ